MAQLFQTKHLLLEESSTLLIHGKTLQASVEPQHHIPVFPTALSVVISTSDRDRTVVHGGFVLRNSRPNS